MINKIFDTNGNGVGRSSRKENIVRFNPTNVRNKAINPKRKNAKPIIVINSLFII